MCAVGPPRPLLLLCCALAGCGGAAARPAGGAADTPPESEAQLEALRERGLQQEQALRELAAQLALARAEARDARERVAEAASPEPRPPVTLGRRDAVAIEEEEPPSEWPLEEEVEEGPRPVLRLHGRPRDAAPPLVLPPPPPGVPDRLPVVPLPGQSAVPPPALVSTHAPTTPAAEPEAWSGPAPAADPVEARYRQALGLVRERSFEVAGRLLDEIVEGHGPHPRAIDARYWRGVVRYARRQYDRALADFRWLVERHRHSERAPEALWKMALCHRRMGDAEQARQIMMRVRREYPDSVAARMASQEDAS